MKSSITFSCFAVNIFLSTFHFMTMQEKKLNKNLFHGRFKTSPIFISRSRSVAHHIYLYDDENKKSLFLTEKM